MRLFAALSLCREKFYKDPLCAFTEESDDLCLLQQAEIVTQKNFGALRDPRLERTRLHELLEILTIALCVVIGGANKWEDIAIDGKKPRGSKDEGWWNWQRGD